MRKPITLLLVSSLCLSLAVFMPWKKMISKLSGENELFEEEEEENERNEAMRMGGAMSQWFWSRGFPDATNLNDKYMNGWYQAEAIRHQQAALRGAGTNSGMWNSLGPNSGVGGRILSIAVDPTNNQKLFCGSASGGIWKSTNQGSNWSYVSTGFPVMGVPSIIIHPTNGNIIYAGTGEVYRTDSSSTTWLPSNTSYAVWKTRGTYGIGILKSTDGGTTWSQVLVRSTDQLFGIQTLRFDPADPNIVYACATDGVYKTTDAGANWNKIFNITYATDIVIQGNTLVVAAGNFTNTKKGIYRTTNGGTNWTKISVTGLASTYQGFIKFGYVSSDPNNIVASIGVSESSTVKELFRSTDFGVTWAALSSSTHTQWQYWCAHDVAINPSNTNKLMYAGVNCFTYTISTGSSAGTGGSIHDDVHDIQYDPTNASIIYVCCDGGIYKTTNGGSTWSAINTGLGATQFYASIGVSSSDANMIVGGLQDNGEMLYNGTSWSTVGGSDGAACVINPSTDSKLYISIDARGISHSSNRGGSFSSVASYLGGPNDSRTAFVAPIVYAPSNTNIAYAGSDNLHKSTNGGSFTGSGVPGTAYIDALHKPALALAVSYQDANKIYASVSNLAQFDNDADGIYVTGLPNVLKTTTGAPPFTSIMGTGGNTLPNRFVTDFAVSPTNDDSVFVTVAGYGTQHVYVTPDGGTNWYMMGAGLPDVPFNAILIDPVNPKILYAGSDLGVYVSPNRGGVWYDFNNGFTDNVAQIMDIQMAADNTLIAATHGKGVWRGARYTGTLPVTIFSFTGEAIPDGNRLQWHTGNEVNVARYEVERSTDAASYQKIGSVPAVNSGAYNYLDPVNGSQSFYYRIKSVDIDGATKYSEVVYLRRNATGVMQVLGNPFSSSLSLRLTVGSDSRTMINLYDMGGRLLRCEKPVIPAGQTTYVIKNLEWLPLGTYYVEAVINNQTFRQKVVRK